MSTVYRFGPFEVRAEQLELRRDRAVVRIEPKPVELLIELLRNANELVTKAELMDSVWADRVVTESVIARCVNKLRDALGDKDQTLVQTVHGYGYRLAAAVTVAIEPSAFSAPPPAIAAGYSPPLRPNWRLVRALDRRNEVWLAEHQKTGDLRVFKFASTAPRVRALRRELTIHRLLTKGLGVREDIARLLDYEFSAPPYFLELEYCPLGNLAEWCTRQGGVDAVPLNLRLDLVAELADALGAAHALGILHLDVKPSNVLIWVSTDGRPHARWCDFGSSHVLEPDQLAMHGISAMDPATALTLGAAGGGGTLNYVAPEVLRGEAPTTRSDLYALGVLLYQLASGDLRQPITAGWEQNVGDPLLREDIGLAANDNPLLRPSSAVALAVRLRTREQRRRELAMARARDAEAARLRKQIEQEQVRRPWRIGLVATLLAAFAASVVQYHDVRVARDEARSQAAVAREVTNFLEHDVLALGSPFNVGDRTPQGVSVHDAVARAAARLTGRFPRQPAVEAALRATIGAALLHDGDAAGAERELRRAMALGATTGIADEKVLQASYSLAFLIAMDQRMADAIRMLDEANRSAGRVPLLSLETRAHRDAMTGNIYMVWQQYALAAPYQEQALAELRQFDPGNVSQIVIRQMYLAWAYGQTGHVERAEALYREALAALRRAEPTPAMLTGLIEERYGITLFMAGHDGDARALLQAGYAHMRGARGADVLAPEALTYMGWVDLRGGRTREAIGEIREACDQLPVPAAGEQDHWTRMRARALLGYALSVDGHPDEGLPILAAALASYDAGIGPDAAEAQLFRLLYLEQALAARVSVPELTAQIRRLRPDRLAEAAPWSADWAARIQSLERADRSRSRTSTIASGVSSAHAAASE